MEDLRINLIRKLEETRNSLLAINYKNRNKKKNHDNLIDEIDRMLYEQYKILSKEIEQDFYLTEQLKKS